MGAGLAALAFWGFLAIIVVAGIRDGSRKRDAEHETARRMLDSGQPIDPEVIERLVGNNRNLDRDLRIGGLIVLFTAPGLALLGWLVSLEAEEWLWPMLGVAALVGFVGIGLLAAASYVERSNRNDDGDQAGRAGAAQRSPNNLSIHT